MKPEDIVNWSFFGYVTPAGNAGVQNWFNGLSSDEKDEIRDVLSYLQPLPLTVWSKPEFEHLGDGISEVRVRVKSLNKTIRIYGFFWPEGIRYSYTFLLGKEKKVKNDEAGKAEAQKRKGKLERREASIDGFDFS
jgi:hypothetical protein